MSKFNKTKLGIAICPFFIWQSERYLVEEYSLYDIGVVFCVHPDNLSKFEGNCQEKNCPLIEEKQ